MYNKLQSVFLSDSHIILDDIIDHPGELDAEDIAKRHAITLQEAIDITERLIIAGLIEQVDND
jgi:predicted transcriptional regulator